MSTLHVIPTSSSASQPSTKRPRIANIVMQESEHGETGPVATCQGCGVRITNYHHAGVVWTYTKSKRSGYLILCKDQGTGTPGYHGCLSSPFYKGRPWMELEAWLAYLLHNVGLDPKDYRRLRERIERGF